MTAEAYVQSRWRLATAGLVGAAVGCGGGERWGGPASMGAGTL